MSQQLLSHSGQTRPHSTWAQQHEHQSPFHSHQHLPFQIVALGPAGPLVRLDQL